MRYIYKNTGVLNYSVHSLKAKNYETETKSHRPDIVHHGTYCRRIHGNFLANRGTHNRRDSVPASSIRPRTRKKPSERRVGIVCHHH